MKQPDLCGLQMQLTEDAKVTDLALFRCVGSSGFAPTTLCRGDLRPPGIKHDTHREREM